MYTNLSRQTAAIIVGLMVLLLLAATATMRTRNTAPGSVPIPTQQGGGGGHRFQ